MYVGMPPKENSLDLFECGMTWKFDRYICNEIVLLLIAMHDDPNPEAIQIFPDLDA